MKLLKVFFLLNVFLAIDSQAANHCADFAGAYQRPNGSGSFYVRQNGCNLLFTNYNRDVIGEYDIDRQERIASEPSADGQRWLVTNTWMRSADRLSYYLKMESSFRSNSKITTHIVRTWAKLPNGNILEISIIDGNANCREPDNTCATVPGHLENNVILKKIP